MRPRVFALPLAVLSLTFAVFADTVILHDGASYSGQLQGLPDNEITFTDNSGVQYKFPAADVRDSVRRHGDPSARSCQHSHFSISPAAATQPR